MNTTQVILIGVCLLVLALGINSKENEGPKKEGTGPAGGSKESGGPASGDPVAKLTPEQLDSIKEEFNKMCDKDTRVITLESLRKFETEQGKEPDDSDLSKMIQEGDTNSDGTLTEHEFISLKARRMISLEAELKKMFELFDVNSNNYIDEEDLKSVMTLMGEKFTDNEIKAIIKDADKDNDGQISFSEFKNMTELQKKMGAGESQEGLEEGGGHSEDGSKPSKGAKKTNGQSKPTSA